MKKRYILVAILLIITVCTPVPVKASTVEEANEALIIAEIPPCTNHNLYIGRVVISDWVSTGSTHTRYRTDWLYCSNCPYIYEGATAVYQEGSHDYGEWQDGGHLPGNRHQASRFCKICDGSKTDIYSCTGNPCRLPA